MGGAHNFRVTVSKPLYRIPVGEIGVVVEDCWVTSSTYVGSIKVTFSGTFELAYIHLQVLLEHSSCCASPRLECRQM